MSEKEAKRKRDEIKCGFCDAVFATTQKLYDHQSAAHDPDGIMFSELGLPK